MAEYIVRRLVLFVPMLLAVSTVVFFIIHIIPGDPAALMLGEGAREEDISALKEKLGLDKPLTAQYLDFLSGLFSGNIGTSIRYEEKISALIAERLPATAELAAGSLIFAVPLAFLLGLLGVFKKDTLTDGAVLIFSLAAVSVPTFALAPLLLNVFSIHLNIFPVSGRGTLAHLALPSITLGLAFSMVLARVLRASLIEVLGEDYIRTARAKGADNFRLVARHALKNAVLPVITIAAIQAGHLFTGAIITETIFSWPGIGRFLYQSILFRDYPAVQGIVLFMAVVYILINLLTDISYALLDPRVRLSAGGRKN